MSRQPVEGKDEIGNTYAQERNPTDVRIIEVPGGKIFMCVTARYWQRDGGTDGKDNREQPWKISSESYGAPVFVPDRGSETATKDDMQNLHDHLHSQIGALARRLTELERDVARLEDDPEPEDADAWGDSDFGTVREPPKPRIRDRLRAAARAWFEGSR